MKNPKNLVLWVVILSIILGIWYLEAGKVPAPQIIQLTPTASTTAEGVYKPVVKDLPKAVEISGPTGFINTAPFKLADFVGNKVVLLDFWTYSCINCQRTLPYLNAWYQKYKDLGLVIVGVHTPEFDFEKDYNNVAEAVGKLGIKYPVVLDSNYGTWNAYNNRYWPNEFLLDIDGYIAENKIGEGDYDKTETAIQKALQERSDRLALGLKIPSDITVPSDVISMSGSQIGTPETYFGSSRNEFLGKTLTLSGNWSIQPEYAETKDVNEKILYNYTAKNVYFVASSKTGVTIKIIQDGKQIGTQIIKDNQLYTLVQNADYGTHSLEIDISGAGLDAFTFTFG